MNLTGFPWRMRIGIANRRVAFYIISHGYARQYSPRPLLCATALSATVPSFVRLLRYRSGSLTGELDDCGMHEKDGDPLQFPLHPVNFRRQAVCK